MRKIISLTLATAMVASMAVSAFAAANAVDTGIAPDDVLTDKSQIAEVKAEANRAEYSVLVTSGELKMTVNGRTYEASCATAREAAIAVYNALKGNGVDVILYVQGPVASVIGEQTNNQLFFPGGQQPQDVKGGKTIKQQNETARDSWKKNLDEIFYTVDGDAAPLVEDGDERGPDGVKPGTSIYYQLKSDFDDTSKFKFDVSKGENAKQIKKVSVVEKKWGAGDLVTINGGSVGWDYTGRHAFVKVELMDNMTDKEYKISFDFKVKIDDKDGATIGGRPYDKGEVSKKFEEIGKVWTYNSTNNDEDLEYLAGDDGIMVKPVKNEENTVLWTDENRDLAKLTFIADSDVAKYFPKLSTKWPNATYAQLFDDQDAFVFDFVGNPKISSTSRAVLELFCPFIDDEDEYTVDPESVVIYQVADDATLAASTEVELAKAILDGRLIDVTDKFTAGENEDGDFVYTTKTRTLGTYIIAEKAPSEEAFEEAEGEAPVEEPTENTEKPNPGTGR
ncbi:MAG: hypothetical protein HFG20_04575 [Anaerotruncus sp.]|nr:hypothetical protein [Anaerotruncus sp.]